MGMEGTFWFALAFLTLVLAADNLRLRQLAWASAWAVMSALASLKCVEVVW